MMTTPAHSVPAAQFIPMLLDGSHDGSCSLETGVKDMNLTVALANENAVPLPPGRTVCARYNLAGVAYDQRHNHMKAIKLIEDANDMKIGIPGLHTPPKFGSDTSYAMTDEMETDRFGRQTAKLPDYCGAPGFTPTPEQTGLVETLIGFMARQLRPRLRSVRTGAGGRAGPGDDPRYDHLERRHQLGRRES